MLLDVVHEESEYIEIVIKDVGVNNDEVCYFRRVRSIGCLCIVLINFAHLSNGTRRGEARTKSCSAAALMMRPEGISISMSMSISISVWELVHKR